MKNDELARTALSNVLELNVMLQLAGGYESTELVEAAHLREAFFVVGLQEELLEGDDALAVVERQQEVVAGADVKWLEFDGAVHLQPIEWNLHVSECQLAQQRHRIANAARKGVQQGDSVVEHGRLELLLVLVELLHELFGLRQVACQLGITCLNNY